MVEFLTIINIIIIIIIIKTMSNRIVTISKIVW